MRERLMIALAKGKLLGDAVDCLAKGGLHPPAGLLDPRERRLVLDDEEGPFCYLLARGKDVATYVSHGAAVLGITGKDTLWESEQPLIEVGDLGFGACRLSLALPREGRLGAAKPRIATKFPRTTERYFRTRGQGVEVIPLHGSIEVAPWVGLADGIVDLVQTGQTLSENGLVEVDVLARSTARLLANGAALRLYGDLLRPVMDGILESTAGNRRREAATDAAQTAPR